MTLNYDEPGQEFCGVFVFRRNFASVHCDGVLYHYVNIEFPAILGPKSPVFLGLPHTFGHNAVDAIHHFHHFLPHPTFFVGRIAAINAFLTAEPLPHTHLFGAVHNFNRNREAMINNLLEQNRNCN